MRARLTTGLLLSDERLPANHVERRLGVSPHPQPLALPSLRAARTRLTVHSARRIRGNGVRVRPVQYSTGVEEAGCPRRVVATRRGRGVLRAQWGSERLRATTPNLLAGDAPLDVVRGDRARDPESLLVVLGRESPKHVRMQRDCDGHVPIVVVDRVAATPRRSGGRWDAPTARLPVAPSTSGAGPTFVATERRRGPRRRG